MYAFYVLATYAPNDLANILCCKVGCLPANFLGLLLGSSRVVWNPILERKEME